jgi:hypothetical protein
MIGFLRFAIGLLIFTFTVSSQEPLPSPTKETEDVKLPNGKSQKDEILKADHAKNLEDLERISHLIEDLKRDLDKNTQYVFSLDDVKKTEEIEKIAKRIRSRMKHY